MTEKHITLALQGGGSHGAFDVTVGQLSRLWRRARRTGALPDKEKLAQALERADVPITSSCMCRANLSKPSTCCD